MATNDAAAVTIAGPSASQKLDRRAGSPVQSKRDRKRQQLSERLATLTEKLSRDKDVTYRDQLQRIQVDTSLILHFDPYQHEVLERMAELRKEHNIVHGDPVVAENARTLLDMSGPSLQDYLQSIEDEIELKDFCLSEHKKEHEVKLTQYRNTHSFKVETAKQEYRALSRTLRDRLINTITTKKMRLNKEKEALDISDSSALLLHPNQFSITNPASPGGPHGKRATRLRRDVDEVSVLNDNKKRKRNPGEEDGSPAPTRRAVDTTPLWQSDRIRLFARQNGPMYSIEKLFTDKELGMTYNTAAFAAHKLILRHRAGGGNLSSPDLGDDGRDGHENGDDDATDTWSAAPMMERQVSHSTRSTRGAAAATQNFIDEKVLGVEGIANFDLQSTMNYLHCVQPPKIPPLVPQPYMKPYNRSTEQNLPISLANEDVQSDLVVMGSFKQYNQKRTPGASLDNPNGLRKVLEVVAAPANQSKYLAIANGPRGDPETLREALGLPTSNVRDETSPALLHVSIPSVAAMNAAAAAVPMSRQSSMGGAGMSRQGSSRGRGRRN